MHRMCWWSLWDTWSCPLNLCLPVDIMFVLVLLLVVLPWVFSWSTRLDVNPPTDVYSEFLENLLFKLRHRILLIIQERCPHIHPMCHPIFDVVISHWFRLISMSREMGLYIYIVHALAHFKFSAVFYRNRCQCYFFTVKGDFAEDIFLHLGGSSMMGDRSRQLLNGLRWLAVG